MPIFGTFPLREYRPKIMAASAALAPKTPRLYALTQRLRRLLARFLPRAADAFDCAVAMRCGFTRFRAFINSLSSFVGAIDSRAVVLTFERAARRCSRALSHSLTNPRAVASTRARTDRRRTGGWRAGPGSAITPAAPAQHRMASEVWRPRRSARNTH